MDQKRIFVIGDSHACFWNGRNQIDNDPSVFRGVTVFHAGPATAHNLQFRAAFGASVIKFLNENRQNIGCIVACFGEIDCRVHIVRIAIIEKKSLDEVVKDFVGRYLKFIRFLVEEFGVPVVMWGPVPSTPPFRLSYNPGHPATGSVIERNYVTVLFNRLLGEASLEGNSLSHISINDLLIDASGVTNADALFDGVHLNRQFLPPAVEKLKEALRSIGKETLLGCLDHSYPILESFGAVNIAPISKYRTSSNYSGHEPKPFTGEPDGHFRFHTDRELRPHIVIDFETRYVIDRIVLYNRLGEFAKRASSIMVECSGDGTEYVGVWCPEEYQVFGGADGEPQRVGIEDKRPYRYVKLSLREEEYFHLDLVQIFVLSFDASLGRPK